MEPRSGTLLVDGGELWYETAGEGAPVVLLHGGLWDSRMWDDQFEPLAERCRAVRYDLRGYGRSSRPQSAYSHSDDLAAVLDHLDIERASLVGLSMGGAVAIDFTLEHPERVHALVLAAPGLGGYEWSAELEKRYAPVEAALEAGDIERAAELELAVWTKRSRKKDDFRDMRMREIAKENAHQVTLDPSLRRKLEPPAIGRLGEIKAPTLVISGDADVPDMKKIAALMLAEIPDARRAVMQGADHVVNMRRPADFTARLLGFLDQVF